MTNLFLVKKYALFSFAAIMLLTSCNSGDAGKTALYKPGVDSNQITAAPPNVTGSRLMNDTLYNLYMDSTEFTSLPIGRKVILVFRAGASGIFKLDGWVAKSAAGTTFDPNRTFQLNVGIASNVLYDTLTHFGNLVLHRDQLRQIRDALNTTHNKYIYFFPEITNQKISYTIAVSNSIPSETNVKSGSEAFIVTTANPSPPHQYD